MTAVSGVPRYSFLDCATFPGDLSCVHVVLALVHDPVSRTGIRTAPKAEAYPEPGGKLCCTAGKFHAVKSIRAGPDAAARLGQYLT